MEPPEDRRVIVFDWPTFVRTLRTRHVDCSQEELARRLDVSAATISNWERGVVEPQWRHKRKLMGLAVGSRYPRTEWPSRSWLEPLRTDGPPPYVLRRKKDRERRRRERCELERRKGEVEPGAGGI